MFSGFLQDLKRRASAARRWIAGGCPLWRAFFLVAVFGFVPYFALPLLLPTDPADRLRVSGALMQVIGILSVIVRLDRSRQLFDRPGLLKTFTSWMSLLKPIFKHPTPKVIKVGCATVKVEALPGRALKAPGKNAPLVERVAHLEKRLPEIEQACVKALTELRRELSKAVQGEQRRRKEEDALLGKQIEEATIGGIHIDMAGVMLLIVGVVLGTVPDFVATLLGL